MKVIASVNLACLLSVALMLSGCGDSAVETSEPQDTNQAADVGDENEASEALPSSGSPLDTAADISSFSSDSASTPSPSASGSGGDFSPPGFDNDASSKATPKVATARKPFVTKRPKKAKPAAPKARKFVSAEPVVMRFENGRPKRKAVQHVYQVGDLKEEMYHGQFQEWWPNGQLWKEGNFKDGKRVGEWQWWREDGKLAKKGAFEADRLVGEWLYHHKDGSLRRSEAWEDGKRQGTVVTYYDGGKNKETEESWVAGQRQGVSHQWYPDGQPKARFEFLSNEPHGTLEEWYENGQQKNKRSFRNGKRHGQSIEWDDEGVEVINHQYEDGERV